MGQCAESEAFGREAPLNDSDALCGLNFETSEMPAQITGNDELERKDLS